MKDLLQQLFSAEYMYNNAESGFDHSPMNQNKNADHTLQMSIRSDDFKFRGRRPQRPHSQDSSPPFTTGNISPINSSFNHHHSRLPNHHFVAEDLSAFFDKKQQRHRWCCGGANSSHSHEQLYFHYPHFEMGLNETDQSIKDCLQEGNSSGNRQEGYRFRHRKDRSHPADCSKHFNSKDVEPREGFKSVEEIKNAIKNRTIDKIA